MKQLIWLAYDLGLQGDYQGLYTWLDAHQAKECGDSLAALTYEHDGDLCAALKKDLQAAFDVNNKTRIYVIYRDTIKHSLKGQFLLGNRKAAPWTGFAITVSAVDIEGSE